MTIARKVVERVFILIQKFFSFLRKQGWLFSLGALKGIHPWVRLNGLFDFCTPWNCQKIKDFLMVLGGGRSLTGLLELVLYGYVVLGVFRWCYVGIALVFLGVPLVFWVMFSCVPPLFCGVPLFHWWSVFRVWCSGVPGFIVCQNKGSMYKALLQVRNLFIP